VTFFLRTPLFLNFSGLTGVNAQNATWNNGETLCACTVWYGWSGPDCANFTSQTYFLLSSTVFQGILALILTSIGGFGVFQFYRKNGRKINAQILTLGLIVFTCFFIACWRWTVFAITLRPGDNTLEAEANDEDKIPLLVPVERLFIGFSLCFAVVAILNVSLLWIQVAKQSKAMSRNMSRNLLIFRRTIFVLEAVLIIVVVGAFASGNTGLAGFGAFPFLLIIIFTYGYGAIRMTDVLTRAKKLHSGNSGGEVESATSERYNELVQGIKKTAVRICILLVCAMICAFAWAGPTVFGAQRDYLDPNRSIQWIVLANEGIPFFMLLSMTVLLQYTRGNIRRSSASVQSSVSSFNNTEDASSLAFTSKAPMEENL